MIFDESTGEKGLCKKVFAAFGGKIFFGWRLVFHDFAKRNHEK
jgi:hypothetical protein